MITENPKPIFWKSEAAKQELKNEKKNALEITFLEHRSVMSSNALMPLETNAANDLNHYTDRLEKKGDGWTVGNKQEQSIA